MTSAEYMLQLERLRVRLKNALNRLTVLTDKLDDNATLEEIVARAESLDSYDILNTLMGNEPYSIDDIDGKVTTNLKPAMFRADEYLTSVYLPKLASVGENAFYNCNNLITAKLGGERFDSYCFSGCSSLKNISLPSAHSLSVSHFFEGCKNLDCVTFCKQGVARLSDSIGMLSGTPSVQAFVFPAKDSMAVLAGSSPRNSIRDTPTLYVYVPRALLDTYLANSYWSTVNASRPIRTIEDNIDFLKLIGADLDDYEVVE